ncbi:hypothetical protein AJ79_05344 [Helicocarpus griseus UAMH5409]|uniref:SCP domain-containing protein n=1 Tax=Helicocarpus griseus UAMH5409 TaxID=1447875 RepID=A0A2B7XNX3_9EURO|nr:hypothetical protein AJ79_05344 [Helicocarpus griseus UAMH5409]
MTKPTFLLPFLLLTSYPLPAQSIVTVTVTATFPPPTEPPLSEQQAPSTPPSYASTPLFRNTILSISNRYRRQHNATALAWNDTLAASALDWARKCRWEHSGIPSTGENLATGYANASAAVEAWGDERGLFDFETPRFSKETGHFSQLVWKGTGSVGCERVWCGEGDQGAAWAWYVVCHYFPQGNVVGMGGEGELVRGMVQARISEDDVDVDVDADADADRGGWRDGGEEGEGEGGGGGGGGGFWDGIKGGGKDNDDDDDNDYGYGHKFWDRYRWMMKSDGGRTESRGYEGWWTVIATLFATLVGITGVGWL